METLEQLIEKTSQYLQEVKEGKEESFTSLYQVTKGYVFLLLEKYGVDENDCQDMLQEVYIAIFHGIEKLEQPQAGVAWIKSITKHKAMDYLRKKYKEQERLQYLDTGDDEEEEFENDVFDLPEDVMENKETQRILKEFIFSLPEAQIKVIQGYYFNDMKVNELAAVLDMNPNTVKTNLRRGKEAIREKVEELQRTTGVRLRSVSILPVLFLFMQKELQDAAMQVENLENGINKGVQKSSQAENNAGNGNPANGNTAMPTIAGAEGLTGGMLPKEAATVPDAMNKTEGMMNGAGMLTTKGAATGKGILAGIKMKAFIAIVTAGLIGGVVWHNIPKQPDQSQSIEKEDSSNHNNKEILQNETADPTPTPTIEPTLEPTPDQYAPDSRFYLGTLSGAKEQEDGSYLLSFEGEVEKDTYLSEKEFAKAEKVFQEKKQNGSIKIHGEKYYFQVKKDGEYWMIPEMDKQNMKEFGFEYDTYAGYADTYVISKKYKYKDKYVLMKFPRSDQMIYPKINPAGERKEKVTFRVSADTVIRYATNEKQMEWMGDTPNSLKKVTLKEFLEKGIQGVSNEYAKNCLLMFAGDTEMIKESVWPNHIDTWRNLGPVFVYVSEDGEVEITECGALDGEAAYDGDMMKDECLSHFYPQFSYSKK